MLKYVLVILVCFGVRWICLLCFALVLGKGIKTGVYLMLSNYNMYCCNPWLPSCSPSYGICIYSYLVFNQCL